MMAQESESRLMDKVIVRLPDGMRDRVKNEAKKNERSMNAEIVARLEASFSGDDRLDQILSKLDRLLPPKQ